MKLTDKKRIAEDLHERLLKAKIVILTDYKGLDVVTLNQLRSNLRELNIEYKVIKNSLLKRASANTNTALLNDFFNRPNAIAISYDDLAAPAKALTQFAKDHEHLEIRVGVMEDKIIHLDDIKALSNLPSREVLLGKILGVLNGVPTAFVRTLSAVPTNFLNVLTALKEKKEAA